MNFTDLLDQSESTTGHAQDLIFVENVIVHSKVGLDGWQRDKEQRVIISCSLFADTREFDKHDDFTKTIDYRSIYNAIKEFDGKVFKDIFDLAGKGAMSLNGKVHTQGGLLEINLPRAVLRCEGGVTLACGFDLSKKSLIPFTLTLTDIKVSCIIGINPHERLKKQPIVVQLRIVGKDQPDDGFTWSNMPEIFDEIIDVCNSAILEDQPLIRLRISRPPHMELSKDWLIMLSKSFWIKNS